MNDINNVEVHALGLGSGHDPIILNNIINLKTTGGSYQFIKV